MADFNLKMIKIFFLVMIAMLVLAMISGINILRGRNLADWDRLKMEIEFLGYQRALAAKEKSSQANSESAKSIPVLLFHGVIKNPDWKGDDTNISLSNFKDQMFALKKAGYRTVTLSEFYDFMKNGKQLPDKSILLTFDDGRRDSYYPVDPLLKALNYSAVMFVISGKNFSVGSRGDDFYLSFSELEDMKKSGRWEIESHGDYDHDWEKISQDGAQGHFLSNLLWTTPQNKMETETEAKKRIMNDLLSAKNKIEKNLGGKALGFAYPFNDYGQESQNFPDARQFLKENIGKIYPLTFFQVENEDLIGNYPDSSQLFIKRIDDNQSLTAKNLLEILDQNREKKLPYIDTFWNNQGWISRWGEKKVWGDLQLGDENGKKSGNLTILLGSQGWKDYSFEAEFQIDRGNSFSQVVDYKDDENYVTCNFSSSQVSITEKISGHEDMIADETSAPNYIADAINKAETVSTGNTVSCYLNGVKAAEAKTNKKLGGGGVGFYMWDDLPDASFIHIRKAEVNARFQSM